MNELKKHLPTILFVTAGVILAADIWSGYQKGSLNQPTPFYDKTLGKLELALPLPVFPLWMYVAGAGVAAYLY